MDKSSAVKPVLLMAIIGLILIAGVGTTFGHQMSNQVNNTTGQGNMMCPCNGSMMPGMMGGHSANETMIHCMMMHGHSANESNETMMHCHCMMDHDDSMAQARLDCASLWLKKAIELHELHMVDPEEADNESSQLELMEQMEKAYACLTGNNTTGNMTGNMTFEMMNYTNHNLAEHDEHTCPYCAQMGMNGTNNSEEHEYYNGCFCSEVSRVECASFWLKKAIELHELHLNDPKEAANESSQMEMMNQMMRAYACINGNHMNMGMDENISVTQAKLDCATFWIKQAIEVHELHLSDPKEAANESSQMEMMNQMMKAYACLTGENMTHNMTMDGLTSATVAHTAGAH
ncbi:MAG: hypothetical protein ACPK85_09770 [Methanosarcina sp.]